MTPLPRVRRAEKRDILRLVYLLKQVNRIHFEARPDIYKSSVKYDAASLEAILRDEATPVFVCEDPSGVVRGYCFCQIRTVGGHPLLRDAKRLYIDDLCVDEAWRGRGLGEMLYRRAAGFAKDEGCDMVYLNVWSFNESARRFYEKMGMTEQRIYMEEKLK